MSTLPEPRPNPIEVGALINRAAALESAAARLDPLAAALPAEFRRTIAPHLGRQVWVGPAATRFEAEYSEQLHRLVRVQHELETLATRFRAEAARLRGEAQVRPLVPGIPW